MPVDAARRPDGSTDGAGAGSAPTGEAVAGPARPQFQRQVQITSRLLSEPDCARTVTRWAMR